MNEERKNRIKELILMLLEDQEGVKIEIVKEWTQEDKTA